MTTISFTFQDDAAAVRLLNDFCDATGWTAASGKTKVEWLKQNLVAFIKLTAKRSEFKTSSAAITAELDAITYS